MPRITISSPTSSSSCSSSRRIRTRVGSARVLKTFCRSSAALVVMRGSVGGGFAASSGAQGRELGEGGGAADLERGPAVGLDREVRGLGQGAELGVDDLELGAQVEGRGLAAVDEADLAFEGAADLLALERRPTRSASRRSRGWRACPSRARRRGASGSAPPRCAAMGIRIRRGRAACRRDRGPHRPRPRARPRRSRRPSRGGAAGARSRRGRASRRRPAPPRAAARHRRRRARCRRTRAAAAPPAATSSRSAARPRARPRAAAGPTDARSTHRVRAGRDPERSRRGPARRTGSGRRSRPRSRRRGGGRRRPTETAARRRRASGAGRSESRGRAGSIPAKRSVVRVGLRARA